jgi:hypothetical protein
MGNTFKKVAVKLWVHRHIWEDNIKISLNNMM